MKHSARQDKSGQWWVVVEDSLDGYPVPSEQAARDLVSRVTFDPRYTDRLLAMGTPDERSWADS
jgi:hypothetical protein